MNGVNNYWDAKGMEAVETSFNALKSVTMEGVTVTAELVNKIAEKTGISPVEALGLGVGVAVTTFVVSYLEVASMEGAALLSLGVLIAGQGLCKLSIALSRREIKKME